MISQINISVIDAQTHGEYGTLMKQITSKADIEDYKSQYDTFMKWLCGANVFTSPTTSILLDYIIVDDKSQTYVSKGQYGYVRLDKNLRNFNESVKTVISEIYNNTDDDKQDKVADNITRRFRIKKWLKEK